MDDEITQYFEDEEQDDQTDETESTPEQPEPGVVAGEPEPVGVGVKSEYRGMEYRIRDTGEEYVGDVLVGDEWKQVRTGGHNVGMNDIEIMIELDIDRHIDDSFDEFDSSDSPSERDGRWTDVDGEYLFVPNVQKIDNDCSVEINTTYKTLSNTESSERSEDVESLTGQWSFTGSVEGVDNNFYQP